MADKTLTPKQKEILDFITNCIREKKVAPSQPEIAKHFDLKSLGSVQKYLVTLQEKGYLSKDLHSRRGVTLTQDENTIPLLGRVAAGKPIEEVLNDEFITVPPTLLRPQGDYFALQVRGQSMIDEGILDGDIVVIRKSSQARNGETVVAVINDEATIKKFYRKQNQIELHPANNNFKPIHVQEKDQFQIAGILSGLIRHVR